LLLLTLALSLACASCGGRTRGLYPVRGKVFYEGKPANGAVVFFHREGAPNSMADLRSAKVGPDGSFELSTSSRGKGAAAGRYVVTVSWTGPSRVGDDEGTNLLPERYLHPATSQLVAEVKEGDNELPPFQLKRLGKR
jgi:hypothetical protein